MCIRNLEPIYRWPSKFSFQHQSKIKFVEILLLLGSSVRLLWKKVCNVSSTLFCTMRAFHIRMIFLNYSIRSVPLIQMGYGKRAIQQLMEYYSGNIVNLNENSEDSEDERLSNGQQNKVLHTSLKITGSLKLLVFPARSASKFPFFFQYVSFHWVYKSHQIVEILNFPDDYYTNSQILNNCLFKFNCL